MGQSCSKMCGKDNPRDRRKPPDNRMGIKSPRTERYRDYAYPSAKLPNEYYNDNGKKKY